MELSEALPILVRFYTPRFEDMGLAMFHDHICDVEHLHSGCPYPESGKYTELDAFFDTPSKLRRRLLRGGPLKPVW